jgi:hypothetical protein
MPCHGTRAEIWTFQESFDRACRRCHARKAESLESFFCGQGLLATLCAALILVNPVAKFAITLDPVGVAANTSLAGFTQGALTSPSLPGLARPALWELQHCIA